MANNAMDWTQSSASAFRQSNTNHFDSSHATDISYLLRDDASGHHSRSQYGVTNEYQPNQLGHNLHPGSQTTGLNIGEHFWPQQNDSSNNTPPQSEHLHNEPIHGHDSHQDAANDTASDQDEPVTDGPVRKKRTAVPRSERRKHYKPKPEPSDPRLFRPFAPNEAKNTMLAQWTTPPIVGTYVMFPNKQLKYNPVPPDLDQVREKLFKMDESVLLKNSQEVADYLPHITNFWRRVVQKHEADEETGVQYEYWYCRSKKSRKPAESVSKGIRNKAQKKVVLHGRLSVSDLSRRHMLMCGRGQGHLQNAASREVLHKTRQYFRGPRTLGWSLPMCSRVGVSRERLCQGRLDGAHP